MKTHTFGIQNLNGKKFEFKVSSETDFDFTDLQFNSQQRSLSLEK